MTLVTELYSEQVKVWPKEGSHFRMALSESAIHIAFRLNEAFNKT